MHFFFDTLWRTYYEFLLRINYFEAYTNTGNLIKNYTNIIKLHVNNFTDCLN